MPGAANGVVHLLYVGLPAHHALISLPQQLGRARPSKRRLREADVTEITMQNHRRRMRSLIAYDCY